MPEDSARLYYGLSEPAPKDWGGRLPLALVFPGRASLALSSLGWQAAYRELAGLSGLAVERIFADPHEKECTALESGRPLSDFALAAFSLSHEEDAANLLAILESNAINPNAGERPGLPIILAGGPLTFLNPAPLSKAVDIFFVGEAEAGLAGLVQALSQALQSDLSKPQILREISALPGVYAPGYSRLPVHRAVHISHKQRNLLPSPAYSCFVSPKAEFKDMLLIEINRGCPYACRFCAAGYIYRPSRWTTFEEVTSIIERTDPPKVGLVGTALTDWPDLARLIAWFAERKTKFSLSSVRADGITDELLSSLRLAGVRTLTLALEAPSRRLRQAANKNLGEETFLAAVALAAKHGINHLKMYLIVGWPGEGEEDYRELLDFLAQVQASGRIGEKAKKAIGHATLTASCLVPKPFTPLQWAPMATLAALESRLAWLKKELKKIKGLRLGTDSPFLAAIQALIARSGPELHDFLLTASRQGFKQAVKAHKLDLDKLNCRERAENEILPWEVVDSGVSREYLWRQWQSYKEAKPTRPCPEKGCEACGVCGEGELLGWKQPGDG